ncbi:MAG: hypothetical protein JWQ11_794 [Rhizobacter sp.]|nr:hypothetical protein [Rhizobacter sp.]
MNLDKRSAAALRTGVPYTFLSRKFVGIISLTAVVRRNAISVTTTRVIAYQRCLEEAASVGEQEWHAPKETA